ncbi:hypothetical protein LQW54_001112 [Pestalotiopsis sp. IQ-011]
MAPDPEQNNFGHGSNEQLVVGSSKLFSGDKLRFIPMPTPDPKVGSLSLAIESIITNLLPLFFFEYNGVDPHIILEWVELFPDSSNINVLDLLSTLEAEMPLWRVNLLATLPIIVNGAACFFLVPLAEAVGRRPVLLICGVATWAGGFMAAASTSFGYHLAARCVQAFGVGAVEALIPLILQDIMFIHQRGKVLATFAASQSIFLVIFGMIWERTPDELAGKEVYPLQWGETRPRLDADKYGPRTKRTDYAIFTTPPRWRNFWQTLKATLRCARFPVVVWAVLLCSAIAGAAVATHQTTPPLLLAAGWKFTLVGLADLSVILAGPFTWLLSGLLGDHLGNWLARRRGGRREPETLLLNIIFPCVLVLAGFSLYGHVADRIQSMSSILLLLGGFLSVWGYSCIFVTMQAFLLESYPNYAGPVLILFSSTKLIIGFALSFKATDWIKAHGFATILGMYAGLIGFIALFGVPVYIWGKKFRARSAGIIGGGVPTEDVPLTPLPPPQKRMTPRDEPFGLIGRPTLPVEVKPRRRPLDVNGSERPDTPIPSIAEGFARHGGMA